MLCSASLEPWRAQLMRIIFLKKKVQGNPFKRSKNISCEDSTWINNQAVLRGSDLGLFVKQIIET